MTPSLILWVLVALFTKHLIVDFMLQGPYQYLNKGNLVHPGGYMHAGLHGIATAVILMILVPSCTLTFLAWLGVLDAIIHYITDFTKVNVCKRFKWTSTTSPYFWWATGIDQYIHCLTYILILVILV